MKKTPPSPIIHAEIAENAEILISEERTEVIRGVEFVDGLRQDAEEIAA